MFRSRCGDDADQFPVRMTGGSNLLVAQRPTLRHRHAYAGEEVHIPGQADDGDETYIDQERER